MNIVDTTDLVIEEKKVEIIYPNQRERLQFLVIAGKCGYKDKIPTIKNVENHSSLAGYYKRFTNWKNKLMIAFDSMNNYNKSKVIANVRFV